jgi:hypothetical protein
VRFFRIIYGEPYKITWLTKKMPARFSGIPLDRRPRTADPRGRGGLAAEWHSSSKFRKFIVGGALCFSGRAGSVINYDKIWNCLLS